MARFYDQDDPRDCRIRPVPGEWDEDVEWPDPVPEPAFEPAHPARIPGSTPGPYRRILRRREPS